VAAVMGVVLGVVLGVAFGTTAATGVAAATAAASSGVASVATSAFAAGWLIGVATAPVADACASMATVAAGTTGSVIAATGVAAIVAASAGVVAGVAGAEAGFAWSTEPCVAAVTGFDASTVDVLVAIAAAAIASGSVVVPGDAVATTMSVAAAGTAITAATGAGVIVAAAGCGDTTGPADAVESVAATMSEAVSLTAAFTMPVFAAPGFAGLDATSEPEPAATGCAALGSASCDGAFGAAFEEGAVSRHCRLSDAAGASSGRCCGDGRSGAAAMGRSLPAVSAALLSIRAEKLSDAGVGSVFADLDDALWSDTLAAVSDVTLNTGGLSWWFRIQVSKDRATPQPK
jgi:hypothetical protein